MSRQPKDRRLCFVDCETTGLDPDRHGIWEVAIILEPGDGEDLTERVWQLPVDLATADAVALNIGAWWERRGREVVTVGQADMAIDGRADGGLIVSEHGMERWADLFARLTWGAMLVGAVPSFDEERLRRLLRRLGACPGWHYQPIDVETLAAGFAIGKAYGVALDGDITRRPGLNKAKDVAEAPPWDSNELSAAIGVNPEHYDRHSALGDARWARAIWQQIMVKQPGAPF